MGRSLKKGPYVDQKLINKVIAAKTTSRSVSIKTWSRAAVITPEMVAVNFLVHNGKDFIQVYVTESMVGHKLGEFSITRRFNGHSKKGKIAKAVG